MSLVTCTSSLCWYMFVCRMVSVCKISYFFLTAGMAVLTALQSQL